MRRIRNIADGAQRAVRRARFAGRIVTGRGWMVRLLLSPLRGPHRHRTGLDGPAPPQPASRAASSPDGVGWSGSSSARFAGRIVTGLGGLEVVGGHTVEEFLELLHF